MGSEAPPGVATAGTDRATASAAQSAKAIEQIRSRSDYTAKALGGVGTAAITALGYAKLADVFPYGGPWWAIVAIACGVPSMVYAVWKLTRAFYAASQAFVTRSDVKKTKQLNDLDPAEVKLLREVYKRTARLNGLETLRAYEARGQRFERVAERMPEAKAKPLGDQATRIATEVSATQARAAAYVLRRRSTAALFAKPAGLLILLFVGGWYFTALGADALQSERSEGITVAKECAEARKAAAIELPKICGTVGASTPAEPTTAFELREEAVAALATAEAACRKAAIKTKPPSLADCAPLEGALEAARRR